jgi:hypothetical protein
LFTLSFVIIAVVVVVVAAVVVVVVAAAAFKCVFRSADCGKLRKAVHWSPV